MRGVGVELVALDDFDAVVAPVDWGLGGVVVVLVVAHGLSPCRALAGLSVSCFLLSASWSVSYSCMDKSLSGGRGLGSAGDVGFFLLAAALWCLFVAVRVF
ncbi:membrane hypothetical protein [Paraburkholderia caribensis]|nr:membrane hypothetical protein [Paraburkholderia caribensis]